MTPLYSSYYIMMEGMCRTDVYYDLLFQTSVLYYTMKCHMGWSTERWHEQGK